MHQHAPEPKYESIEQLNKLFKVGYVINRITYPITSDGVASIIIDIIEPNKEEECLLTVFGEESVALSHYVESLFSTGK
ncbi:hypothetical protein BH18THE2_BH18THE2_21510 [soil metagenome]